MKRCVIVAGGERAPIAPLREGDFLLACDRGLVYALEEGLRPDLILGDFDSYSGDLPPEIPVLRYPVEKDDTDAMLAVRWAIENGFGAVRLCCALGGSLDHLLANLQTLHFAAEAGLDYIINAVGTIAYALTEEEKREYMSRFKDTPMLAVAAESDVAASNGTRSA